MTLPTRRTPPLSTSSADERQASVQKQGQEPAGEAASMPWRLHTETWAWESWLAVEIRQGEEVEEAGSMNEEQDEWSRVRVRR